jgi:hypothetical protein
MLRQTIGLMVTILTPASRANADGIDIDSRSDVLYSRRLLTSAAVVLLLAVCMIDSAWAGGAGGPVGLLATLDGRLPLEPRLPGEGLICSTVKAGLSSAAFASPSATDPDIDSIAAVTANPLSSNPDTARIQGALDSCHQRGVVKLVSAGSNNAFLAGALTLPSGVTLKVCIQREKQPIVIDPYNSAPSSTTTFQPDIHDIHYLGVHAVNLPGAKYPSSTNWNNVINGVSATNLTSNVVLDNVFFDVAPAWGNSSKAPFTGSPDFVSFVIGTGSTSFPIPTTGQDVTVTGAPAGTATSENAVDCSSAFPPFSSVNDKSPI